MLATAQPKANATAHTLRGRKECMFETPPARATPADMSRSGTHILQPELRSKAPDSQRWHRAAATETAPVWPVEATKTPRRGSPTSSWQATAARGGKCQRGRTRTSDFSDTRRNHWMAHVVASCAVSFVRWQHRLPSDPSNACDEPSISPAYTIARTPRA